MLHGLFRVTLSADQDGTKWTVVGSHSPGETNSLIPTKAKFLQFESRLTMTETGDERPWTGDVNEAVVDDWIADTTAFDRVRAVADATSEPHSASEIADRARVSDPTARKYLDTMAESGRIRAIGTGNGTRYMRSPQAMAMERIASIHREHTRDEIRSAIKRFEEELSALRDTYEVSDVDDLVVSLDAEDDGWTDVSRWQRVEENLKVTRAALSLYDFDPDDSRTAATRLLDDDDAADTDRGAFEFESESEIERERAAFEDAKELDRDGVFQD